MPMKIELLKNVKSYKVLQIYCGPYHSLLLVRLDKNTNIVIKYGNEYA